MRSTAGSSGSVSPAPPLAFGVDTRTFGFDSHELVRRVRKLRLRTDLSCTLFLCDPADYDGGELVIEGLPGQPRIAFCVVPLLFGEAVLRAVER